ncbi:MAG: MMPL family transporter [Planctomycetota bacterium]|nr:MMPL family transporter [Planctomycetota bacterium]
MDRWGAVVSKHPRRVLAGAALVGLLCLPPSAWLLAHLDANIFNQVSDDLPRFRTTRELSEDFGGDVLITAISITDEARHDPVCVEELKAFGDLLAKEFAKIGLGQPLPGVDDKTPEEPWLRQVECRIGEDLKKSLVKLAQEHPTAVLDVRDVEQIRKAFEPGELRARLKTFAEERRGADAMSVEYRKLMADPLKLSDIAEDARKRRAGGQGLQVDANAGGYVISPDNSMLLVLARPVVSPNKIAFDKALMAACKDAENRAIQAFRARTPAPKLSTSLKETFTEYAPGENAAPSLSVGYTGLHAITTENEMSLRWDILSTTASSVVAVLCLFLLVYRRLWLAVDIGLTMGLAILVTLTLAWLLHGPIGVMGAGFTCVLLGMGVDYGIHLYTTYQALRMEARLGPAEGIHETIRRCGSSVFAASMTTVAAFLGIATTHFRGLAELGLLAGLGLLVSAVAMVTVFPALLSRSGQGEVKVAATIRRSTVVLGKFHGKRKRAWIGLLAGVLAASVALTLIVFGPDPGPDSMLGVRFDAEFGNLRSLNIKAIPLRSKIEQRFGRAFADINVVTEGPDEASAFAAAEEAAARLAPELAQGDLRYSGGISNYVPSPRQQKAALAALKSLDVAAMRQRFLDAARELFPRIEPEDFFAQFLENLDKTGKTFGDAKPLTLAEVLQGPLGPMLSLYARIDAGPEGGPRVRLVNKYFPKELEFTEAWGEALAERLQAPASGGGMVRVTSGRMVGFELKRSLLFDMEWISAVVAAGVVILLIVSLRSFKRAALAAVPLIFSFLFVLAGVVVAQINDWDFAINYVNLMIFPILIGSGIDYGVYIVTDIYSSRRPDLFQVVSETGRGVILCGLTTLAGFGSMIWGSYTGLISFGWAANLGYVGALFGALVVLPAILSYIGMGVRKDD